MRTETKLRMQHTSLQFSDGPKQQRFDIERVFSLGQDFPVKTGTESPLDRRGTNDNMRLVREFARRYNHSVHFAGDNWVAVDNEIVFPGSVKKGSVFVIAGSQVDGPGEDRVMPTIQFRHRVPGVGVISMGAVHYATKGQTRARVNYEPNKLYADRIESWMRKAGSGYKIAFAAGDWNMNDRMLDWAMGNGFTSIADELKRWQNTGHGPIDGWVSYDKDKRVRPLWFNVLDDTEQFMHFDHYVCRSAWAISHTN